MSTHDLFGKTLQRLATCLSVNNSLRIKLVLSSTIIFDDTVRVASIAIFVADFNLRSCEADDFKFTVLYGVVLC